MDNQNNSTQAYTGPQKICKYCKKAIPKAAKTCPHCMKKQGGQNINTIIIVVVAVIALFVIVGNLGSSSTPEVKDDKQVSNQVNNVQNDQQDNQQDDQQGAAPTVPEKVTPKAPAFDYEFSDVVDLVEEYKENEVSADSKYKGKTVKVTGIVKDIGKDILDSAYITLGDGKDITWDYAQCYFKNKDEVAKIENIQKGDTVTLIGKVDSYLLSLTINKCEFFEETAE